MFSGLQSLAGQGMVEKFQSFQHLQTLPDLQNFRDLEDEDDEESPGREVHDYNIKKLVDVYVLRSCAFDTHPNFLIPMFL